MLNYNERDRERETVSETRETTRFVINDDEDPIASRRINLDGAKRQLSIILRQSPGTT